MSDIEKELVDDVSVLLSHVRNITGRASAMITEYSTNATVPKANALSGMEVMMNTCDTEYNNMRALIETLKEKHAEALQRQQTEEKKSLFLNDFKQLRERYGDDFISAYLPVEIVRSAHGPAPATDQDQSLDQAQEQAVVPVPTQVETSNSGDAGGDAVDTTTTTSVVAPDDADDGPGLDDDTRRALKTLYNDTFLRAVGGFKHISGQALGISDDNINTLVDELNMSSSERLFAKIFICGALMDYAPIMTRLKPSKFVMNPFNTARRKALESGVVRDGSSFVEELAASVTQLNEQMQPKVIFHKSWPGFKKYILGEAAKSGAGKRPRDETDISSSSSSTSPGKKHKQ